MSQDITSNHCTDQLPLLLYGELSFDEEEHIESHLAACAECRSALEQQQELMATFDSLAVEPSPALLRQARSNLFAHLEQEPPVARHSWWDRLVEFTIPQLPAQFLKPAGAFALVAMGFMGARVAPGILPGWTTVIEAPADGRPQVAVAGFDTGTPARVRYVKRADDGRIQIVLDETRQRTVMGHMDDPDIRNLLLAATRDPSDPGLRAETMGVMASISAARMQGGSPQATQMAAEVKAALLFAIHDQNDGVRLKALEGLRTFAPDAEIRSALSEVLLTDRNPAMRNQAIDLLMQGLESGPADAANRPESGMLAGDVQMVDLLEQMMKREEKNPYVRQRSQRALELVNAVRETY